MFWNRSSGNRLLGFLAPILYRFSKTNRFKPDLYLEEGTELAQHGFNARVVSIPGHSKGSVGILTAGGDLFCGDLLENTDDPAINSIMDDAAAADRSIQVLGALEIGTVYPGHGRPFLMSSFKERYAVGDKAED
jgi:glyoxylase-like metal-dependent hydrolase (beta-lactamase superfamily II)